MIPGRTVIGNLNMLKRDKLTNAVLASSTLFLSIETKAANETMETIRGANTNVNEEATFIKPIFFK